MRVIMANRLFTGYLGGVERYIASLSSELVRLGVDVVVCTAGATRSRTERGLNIECVASLRDLRRFIGRGGDVVHAHLPRNPFSFEALRAAHDFGLRTVFTPHAFYPGGHALKRFAKLAVDLTATRYTMQICDKVVNLTPRDREDAIRNGLEPSKSEIIPNSISVRDFSALADEHAGETLDVDRPYLLHVGRFDPVKNIGFLVRAQQRLPDLDLVLIGQDDGELAKTRALISQLRLDKRVHIIERANAGKLTAAYMNASAIVLSSRWEGLPTVLLEGLFLRKPFVATDVGGNGWLAEQAPCGWVVPLDDEDAYVEAVGRALRAPDEDREAGRDLVLRRFSWEANARRLVDIYSR